MQSINWKLIFACLIFGTSVVIALSGLGYWRLNNKEITLPAESNITGYLLDVELTRMQLEDSQQKLIVSAKNGANQVEIDLASDRAASVIFPNWTLLDNNYVIPPAECRLVELKYRTIEGSNEIFETTCYAN